MKTTKPTDQGKALQIGLTGGIGCGKSTVAKILESMGLARLDTDIVAREVVQVGSPGLTAIIEEFGEIVIQPDGSLDRSALGKIVFADLDKLARLENVLHPRIWQKVSEFHQSCELQGQNSIVEVPLLFENSRQDKFTETWVVSTDRESQFERLRIRNSWSDEEISNRIRNQMPLADKVKLADVVIENSGDISGLRSNVGKSLANSLDRHQTNK